MMEENAAKLAVQGFARVHLKSNGELVGDSGWLKNAITERGIDDFLAMSLIGSGSPDSVAAAALGIAGAPATNTASLPGEITDETNSRHSDLSRATVIGAAAADATCRWYGTFGSGSSHFSTTHDISNIGLYNSSATNAGSVLCGAVFATSNLNTNQDVEFTYEWRFATTT